MTTKIAIGLAGTITSASLIKLLDGIATTKEISPEGNVIKIRNLNHDYVNYCAYDKPQRIGKGERKRNKADRWK